MGRYKLQNILSPAVTVLRYTVGGRAKTRYYPFHNGRVHSCYSRHCKRTSSWLEHAMTRNQTPAQKIVLLALNDQRND